MSPPRYERVAGHDEDDSPISGLSSQHQTIPDSPPPSFRSRTSSRQPSLYHQDPLTSDADRTLEDTFGAPSDDESDDEGADGPEQRLIRGSGHDSTGERANASEVTRPRRIERQTTDLAAFVPPPTAAPTGRVYGGGNAVNDGVFANLNAKPTRGEEVDEKPPSYEQAAADASPPYWETTILAPHGGASDEVYVDGLPVGSVFSFIWNAMISMSFQLVGFLLTYLLHTTHAAKNGSRAGLGITLVHYGFTMKGFPRNTPSPDPAPPAGGASDAAPPDPNAHDFDPSAVGGVPDAVAGVMTQDGSGHHGLNTTDWLAYALMVIGWFILIRSVSNYIKARRHEQLVLQSPERNLGVTPVIVPGEAEEGAV